MTVVYDLVKTRLLELQAEISSIVIGCFSISASDSDSLVFRKWKHFYSSN